MRTSMRLHLLAVAAVAAAAMAAAGPAHADAQGALGKRLAALDQEATQLAQGIQRPDLVGRTSLDQANRRLIDAQVAFGTGNYDDAAVLLYEYVQKHPDSRSFDTALYYLAEALYQKRDHVASRTYFTRLVRDVGSSSKFYQQGLQRLIELSLALRDNDGVDEWLSALDRVPEGQRRPSVPYVRGKYAYAAERYDEALGHFASVPPGSEYHLQSRYFMGVCHVAQGAIGEAIDVYAAMIAEERRSGPGSAPRGDDDQRVIELARLALGRLYYERDQPAQAIDQYLEIERKSELFDEALYEVAWVYVKDRQFDKALRALELLALSDPSSSKTPAVKILEANLRIRKAQAVTLTAPGNSAEEYAKAQDLFEWIHDSFEKPHGELVRIVAEHEDPQAFMAQITGRMSETFAVHATLPEIAAGWLREEPTVARITGIEADLGVIAADIAEAKLTIERLDQALSSPARVNIFPALARKRTRATEIFDEVLAIRRTLAARERAVLAPHASEDESARLDALAARREGIARQLAALPGAGTSHSKRVEQARQGYVALDQRAAEVATAIEGTQATLVAIDKYVRDQAAAGAETPNAASMYQAMNDLRAELEAMRTELEEVRRAALLARDETGTGDPVTLRARALRAALRQVLDEEQALAARVIGRMQGDDRRAGARLATLLRAAGVVTGKVGEIEGAIDDVVAFALADVGAALVEEKARLAAYERELAIYEQESRDLGGTILGTALAKVKKKLADVLVRSDIGVIDVAWSQKEDIDETVRKLVLDELRELRTLQDEFRDIVEEERTEAQASKQASKQASQEGRQ